MINRKKRNMNKLFEKFYVTNTQVANMLGVSRVTFNISKNEYYEHGTCTNQKCLHLFTRLDKSNSISKLNFKTTVRQINLMFDNLDKISKITLSKDMKTVSEILSAVSRFIDKGVDHDGWNDLILDRELIKFSKAHGRFFNAQYDEAMKWDGNVISMRKNDLVELISKYKVARRKMGKF